MSLDAKQSLIALAPVLGLLGAFWLLPWLIELPEWLGPLGLALLCINLVLQGFRRLRLRSGAGKRI